MSWDVSLDCPMCHESWGESEINYTHNCNNMMYEATGFSMWDIKDVSAADAIPKLTALIEALEKDPERFRAMNPSNGWGDYDSLLSKFLRPFLNCCKRKPGMKVYISG